MPRGLERRQNTGQLHFITFSCHHRLPYLQNPDPKHILEQVIERTRSAHNLIIYAYVLMPEHVHLLLSEPEDRILSSTIRVLKGQSSKLLKGSRDHFWQPRYYDFNVFTTAKFVEKVRYIHRNPVSRGLATKPEDYPWSSFTHYAANTPTPIKIDRGWTTTKTDGQI
ncbi:transposase [Tunturibacter psychrotolerans]|uniref:Transposase n=1 Tax=Tunturiibacter psychrotolerans TaxID=3069686 RepID=A0AAU7ZPG2_9BACT